MKKTYLHIYIVLMLFVATFIIGSFFDFQINDALFSNKNTFGLIISVIGTVPGYGVLAFLGGGFLYLGLKREKEQIWMKALLFGFAVATFASSVYFSGKEFFGPNGFDYLGIKEFWGFFIAFPVDVAIAFLGYKITSKHNNDKLWLIYIILAVGILIALVAGVTLLKAIFHRPRFRSLGLVAGLDYHNWWDPCKNYKDLIAASGGTLISEEFKSFPSGHAGTCAVLVLSSLFLPYINEKYEKVSLVVFYSSLAWLLLVCFARMRVGAHFLSDVSMGSLISIIILFVAKIIIDNVKYFSHSQNQGELER